MFQIWFDPDLNKTLKQEASYDDYSIDQFPLEEANGIKKIIYKGEGSPLSMDTPGIEILSYEITEGKQSISMDSSKVYSFYLVSGNAKIDGEELETDDFTIVQDVDELAIESIGNSKFFVVASPKKINYNTYAKTMMQ